MSPKRKDTGRVSPSPLWGEGRGEVFQITNQFPFRVFSVFRGLFAVHHRPRR